MNAKFFANFGQLHHIPSEDGQTEAVNVSAVICHNMLLQILLDIARRQMSYMFHVALAVLYDYLLFVVTNTVYFLQRCFCECKRLSQFCICSIFCYNDYRQCFNTVCWCWESIWSVQNVIRCL